MRYTDRRGRRQTLTFPQFVYLDAAQKQGGFDCGWGGLDSTLTVRLLEERGLIQLRVGFGYPRWRVVTLLSLGASVLERWKEADE